MSENTRHIRSHLDRIEGHLRAQRGRAGLIQNWLEDHDRRLDLLDRNIDAHLERLEALIRGE